MILVTGGGGFIGSHLVDRLVSKGYSVRVLDNFSSGSIYFLRNSMKTGRVEVVAGDLRDRELIDLVLRDVDVVFHMAANPEVRIYLSPPSSHFDNNIVATYNLLEGIRRSGSVEKLVFASSSTVYGDPSVIPTPEDADLKPISVYGASKLACESLIRAYSLTYGFKAVSLRYANIIGSRLRHGVIYDFIMKLKRDPSVLEVLGDGTQEKSYLYIDDAIDATMVIAEKMGSGYMDINVSNDDWIKVSEIAAIVSRVMGVNPKIIYRPATSDGRGWVGDVKKMLLSNKRLKSYGWRPRYTSREAVERAAKDLVSELL